MTDVVLRPWRRDDVTALESARDASLPALATWTPGMHGDLADVPAFLDRLVDAFDRDEFLGFAMTLDAEVVGYCSLKRATSTEAEVGYWVRSDRTGRGIATTAIGLLVDFAVAHWPDVDHIVLKCDEANIGSVRVAERNGFVRVSEAVFTPRNATQSGVELRWERPLRT